MIAYAWNRHRRLVRIICNTMSVQYEAPHDSTCLYSSVSVDYTQYNVCVTVNYRLRNGWTYRDEIGQTHAKNDGNGHRLKIAR